MRKPHSNKKNQNNENQPRDNNWQTLVHDKIKEDIWYLPWFDISVVEWNIISFWRTAFFSGQKPLTTAVPNKIDS